MHDALRSVARRTNTPLIDIRRTFEASAEFGIPGDVQLIDHVHPRIEWHQKIADVLCRELVSRGVVKGREGTQARRDRLYEENYASLPHNYFPESVERLRGLKIWAAGRATRLRVEPTGSTELVPSAHE